MEVRRDLYGVQMLSRDLYEGETQIVRPEYR